MLENTNPTAPSPATPAPASAPSDAAVVDSGGELSIRTGRANNAKEAVMGSIVASLLTAEDTEVQAAYDDYAAAVGEQVTGIRPPNGTIPLNQFINSLSASVGAPAPLLQLLIMLLKKDGVVTIEEIDLPSGRKGKILRRKATTEQHVEADDSDGPAAMFRRLVAEIQASPDFKNGNAQLVKALRDKAAKARAKQAAGNN